VVVMVVTHTLIQRHFGISSLAWAWSDSDHPHTPFRCISLIGFLFAVKGLTSERLFSSFFLVFWDTTTASSVTQSSFSFTTSSWPVPGADI
jgi:hypothetical protein